MQHLQETIKGRRMLARAHGHVRQSKGPYLQQVRQAIQAYDQLMPASKTMLLNRKSAFHIYDPNTFIFWVYMTVVLKRSKSAASYKRSY